MTTPVSAHDLKRAIEEILDDVSLPRYLQVNRILELFDGQSVVKIVEVPVEVAPEPPSRARKAPQKKKPPKRKKVRS